MLIRFNVENYRSFKDLVTFSMVAAKLSAKHKELDINNLFPISNSINLLKSAAIYGANASGKSNLLDAVGFMRQFVLTSSRESLSTDPIDVEAFRLSTETAQEPSLFEVVFFLNGTRYRYGFEVDKHKVHSEWLYHAKVRETRLFARKNGEIILSKVFREGKGLAERTRDNALFLSVADQWNGPISQSISGWFKRLGFISGLSDVGYRMFTLNQMAEGGKLKDDIVAFVKEMDLNILDLEVKRIEMSEERLPRDMPQELKALVLTSTNHRAIVTTLHKKYDSHKKQISLEEFDLDDHESEGTQKIFSLSGPLLHALQNGQVLIIDELDARLHPLITCSIIKLFNSNITNPRNAQLVFATHDTNLLSNELFRRDQIWFTEKDQYGATDLYSLAEYKVRNDASFESDYISGRYGAIPFLGEIKHLVGDSDA